MRNRYLSADHSEGPEVGSRKRWTKGPPMDFPDLKSNKERRNRAVMSKLPLGAKSDTESSSISPERLPNLQSPSRNRKRMLEARSQDKLHEAQQVPDDKSPGSSPKRSTTRTLLRSRRGHEVSKSNPALSKSNSRRLQEKEYQQEKQDPQPKKLTSPKLDDTLRRLDWQQKEYVKRRKNRSKVAGSTESLNLASAEKAKKASNIASGVNRLAGGGNSKETNLLAQAGVFFR